MGTAVRRLRRYEVQWFKKPGAWRIVVMKRPVILARSTASSRVAIRWQTANSIYYTDKPSAVRDAAALCKRRSPAQLIVRKKNGEFQEERTYPRGRDPKRTPG